jgi:hypothetical protein
MAMRQVLSMATNRSMPVAMLRNRLYLYVVTLPLLLSPCSWAQSFEIPRPAVTHEEAANQASALRERLNRYFANFQKATGGKITANPRYYTLLRSTDSRLVAVERMLQTPNVPLDPINSSLQSIYPNFVSLAKMDEQSRSH